MSKEGDLNRLNDIIISQDPGLLPLAPGWAVLISAVLFTILIFSIHLFIKYRKDAYKRHAVKCLKIIKKEIKEKGNLPARGIPVILKETAVKAYPHETVASVNGREWVKLLEDKCPGYDFSEFSLLPVLAYSKCEDVEKLTENQISGLLNRTEFWIKNHIGQSNV